DLGVNAGLPLSGPALATDTPSRALRRRDRVGLVAALDYTHDSAFQHAPGPTRSRACPRARLGASADGSAPRCFSPDSAFPLRLLRLRQLPQPVQLRLELVQ